MPALDTNIIVRHLTADHPEHSPRARHLFEGLAVGQSTAALREAVLVEAVQVLSSKALYNLPRSTIANDLSELIRMPGVGLRPKSLYLRALHLYGQYSTLSFVDCLLAATAEREDGQVLSFDQGFDRLTFITRVEP